MVKKRFRFRVHFTCTPLKTALSILFCTGSIWALHFWLFCWHPCIYAQKQKIWYYTRIIL